MKQYIMFIMFVILSGNSFAMGLSTGTDVLRSCEVAERFLAGKSKDLKAADACIDFLVGFDSGQSLASLTRDKSPLYCQPKGSDTKAMVSTIVYGLKADSHFHNSPAGIAVWKALASAWPCTPPAASK